MQKTLGHDVNYYSVHTRVLHMYLVRHGQSDFNLNFSLQRRDPGIVDPGLTALGEQQARQAADDLAKTRIDYIISSPYRRALETASIIAELLAVPVTIDHRVCEQFGFSCDIGTQASVLKTRWPRIDFADLRDIWWPRSPETEHSVRKRAQIFYFDPRHYGKNTTVVVVTHWALIKSLTGTSVGNGSIVKK